MPEANPDVRAARRVRQPLLIRLATQGDQANKLVGHHALLLNWFSEAVELFYRDMTEHGLADNLLMMQWSEFGRRPGENASFGSDHGTVAPIFVIGNPVTGGLYGDQPSLAAAELDRRETRSSRSTSEKSMRRSWIDGSALTRRRCWAPSIKMLGSLREKISVLVAGVSQL